MGPFTMGSSAELDPRGTSSTEDSFRTATNLLKRAANFDQLPYGVAFAAGTLVWIIAAYG
jgi:hypothetical protein